MRCAICPAKYRCVPGDGPQPARVMTIGEAPGRDEDAGGRPFIGQAGREFNNNYLRLAGLDRDEIYVTNTVKCRPDLNRKPSPTEVAGCASHHLPTELATVAPEIVVLMGATACSLVPNIDLEADHGIPRLGELYNWSGWIVPMYHPASGLHDTAMMTPMLEDWEGLRKWLESGEWTWPVDSTARDYGLIETRVEAQEYLHKCCAVAEPLLIGGDTESHDRVPYSWQISIEHGVARMVMLKNQDICELLSGWLCAQLAFGDATFVFHQADADLDIFEQLIGGSLHGLYRDTMKEAYHFGNLRQGLKPLAKRLLGRQRLSWDETVTPYSKDVLCQWIMKGFTYAEQFWQTQTPRFHKKSGKPLQPTIVRALPEKLLPELFTYSLRSTDYPIWQKLYERMPEEWIQRLVEVVGEVPQKGIAHCPIEVQIEYACSDPDDTRQLAVLFDRMRKEFVAGLNVQDEDKD